MPARELSDDLAHHAYQRNRWRRTQRLVDLFDREGCHGQTPRHAPSQDLTPLPSAHPKPSTRATDSPIENHACTRVIRMLWLFREVYPFLQENTA
jgi:hypothetical protein